VKSSGKDGRGFIGENTRMIFMKHFKLEGFDVESYVKE
jgi:hypothetical protein